MAKKNETFEVQITGLTDEGMGVGRVGGMAVFVPATCVGDRILGAFTKVEKKYAYGRLTEILEPSDCRVQPDCALFPRCGGCTFWQMTYAAELEQKQQMIEDKLERLGGISLKCEQMLSGRSARYRNKAIYPIGFENGKLIAGFYARHSHRIVPVNGTKNGCLLQPALFAKILDAFLDIATTLGWSAYDEQTNSGLLRHLFLRGNTAGQVLVCPIVTDFDQAEALGASQLASQLCEKVAQISGVVLNQNKRGDNVLLGEECRLICGSGVLTDTLCGLTFSLSPLSFYQVNRPMAQALYATAAEFAQPEGKTVLDLYCGAGTIGLSMASKAKKVIGVEVVEQAIENARQNAAQNGIANAQFFCADASKASRMLAEQGLRPDVVILDPPRKGCDSACLDAVASMAPKQVVMISCNPATAARDLARLRELGFEPKRLRGADLFPKTAHVECCVLLERTDESL